MDVIGHDDPRMQKITALIEMMEGLCHDAGMGGLPEQTGAVAMVEVPVNRGREKPMVFKLRFGRPGCRVILAP